MQRNDNLVGHFFLDITENGTYQGIVGAELPNNHYLVEYFSWLDGSPTHRAILRLTDMYSFKLYGSKEDWNAAGQAQLKQEEYKQGLREHAHA